MTKIRILDDATINKIAAGEVIENPASVVKELVENAIDAGAREIYVETQAGGRGLIKVVDNGCGMSADEMLLALERHATSKISQVEDLNSLSTLGFRGEALPSIASVSRMLLHSSTISSGGNLIEIEGGRVKHITPSPRKAGTTIEVRSLFFNVPVRKKFQKSLASDTAEIHKTLALFSLCYPHLGFSWTHDQEQQCSFLAQDGIHDRLKFLLGDDLSKEMLPVEHASLGMSVTGKISTPALHRPNRTGQFLFINGRNVMSPYIAKRVLEAYATRLPTHRFPLFVLHLSLPPDWLDVNVHPQKKEVRLREEEKFSSFLAEALKKTLERKAGNPSPATALPHLPPAMQFPLYEVERDLPIEVCEPAVEYLPREKELFGRESNVIAKRGPFFLIEEPEGIRLLHGIRALERIIFDELENKERKPAVQSLLLPIKMTFTGREKILLEEMIEQLQACGIAIRHFGGDTFLVDAIPALLETSEIETLILHFLEEGHLPRNLGKCLKRGSISVEAAKTLLPRLFACKESDFTPTGKRIHALLDETALHKMLHS